MPEVAKVKADQLHKCDYITYMVRPFKLNCLMALVAVAQASRSIATTPPHSPWMEC